METLADVLPEEIKRVQEIIVIYRDPALKGAGGLAAAMMERDIDRAMRAMLDNDLVEMVRVYQALKGYEL